MVIPYVPLLGLLCFPLSQLQKSLLKENSLQSFMITRFLKKVWQGGIIVIQWSPSPFLLQ